MHNDAKYRDLEMINTPQKVAQSSQLAATAWMMIWEKNVIWNPAGECAIFAQI